MRKMAVLVLAAFASMPSAAAGGGGWWSWIDLEKRTVAIGQEATIHSEVMWETLEEAEEARSGVVTYHAFLMPMIDKKLERNMWSRDYRPGWWKPQPDSIDLGPLSFRNWSGNIADATVTYTVPELAPGRYFLMFCTPGCERELGYMIPTELQIVASAAHARAANRVDELKAKVWEARASRRSELRGLRRELARQEQLGNGIDERLDLVASRLKELKRPVAAPEPDQGMPDSSLLALGALVGAAAVFMVMRRRPIPARKEIGWTAVDDVSLSYFSEGSSMKNSMNDEQRPSSEKVMTKQL